MASSIMRTPYDPPVRAGVRCTNCRGEIQATARLTGPVEIVGLHGYEWTHVGTDNPDCPPLIRRANPYDGWRASVKVREALEQHIAEALAVVSAPLAEHTTRAIGRLLPADLHDVEEDDE